MGSVNFFKLIYLIMKLSHFIGIDISKATFSFYILCNGTKLIEGQLSNSDEGVLEFIQLIRQQGFSINRGRTPTVNRLAGLLASWLIPE